MPDVREEDLGQDLGSSSCPLPNLSLLAEFSAIDTETHLIRSKGGAHSLFKSREGVADLP